MTFYYVHVCTAQNISTLKIGAAAGNCVIFINIFRSICFPVAATGDGEIIMRYCPSFLIVQLINQGFTPEEACKTAIRKMTDSYGKWFEIGVIALNNQVSP